LYIAPEQAENSGAVDQRADIYALGCTLFHLVTGIPPYRGDSPVEIILAHVKKPVPELHKTDHSIPSGFSDVIRTMMEKKPEKRFSTPCEARQALQSIFSVPLKPRSISPSKRSHTHLPIPSAIKALLALAIIIFGGTLFFMANRKSITTYILNGVRLAENDRDTRKSVDDNTTLPSRNHSDEKNSVLQTVLQHDIAGLQSLLNSGKSPNPIPGDSLSPLHAAVSIGDSASLVILLSMGANPNIRDSSGDTPLHNAIRSNNIVAVKSLLSKGANPNLTDHNGNKPLQIASNNNEIISLLWQFGGR
jgi:serine/threonine protein kinase